MDHTYRKGSREIQSFEYVYDLSKEEKIFESIEICEAASNYVPSCWCCDKMIQKLKSYTEQEPL